MTNYYSRKLSAERLQACYKIAPPRIRQYQKAEIRTVLERIKPGAMVLDLGCGYGRVFNDLRKRTKHIFGADISLSNLSWARSVKAAQNNDFLVCMNASLLGFLSGSFDLVFCIQNGISAFKEDPEKLISESVRVTKRGGTVLFSSYSDKIWDARLEWFRMQAERGLLGEIDNRLTGNGVIVCKDGFRATTYTKQDFWQLTRKLDKKVNIFEIDESSVFCEIFI